jgi:hypothetical protein
VLVWEVVCENVCEYEVSPLGEDVIEFESVDVAEMLRVFVSSTVAVTDIELVFVLVSVIVADRVTTFVTEKLSELELVCVGCFVVDLDELYDKDMLSTFVGDSESVGDDDTVGVVRNVKRDNELLLLNKEVEENVLDASLVRDPVIE